MNALDPLLEKMTRGDILANAALPANAIIDFLEEREDPDFRDRWMAACDHIEKSKTKPSDDADERVAQLRKLAYLQIIKRFESPELAAVVADDFGLIGDALAHGVSNAFAAALLQSYINGTIPDR
jgi:hypothetical protein